MAGVLLYDADCGFCTRAARIAPKLRLAVGVYPMQSADLPGLGVDPERARRELPFVDPAGAVSYGHLAVAAALRTGPAPARLAGALMRAPVLTLLFRVIYAAVAANRHRLPGATASCRV